MSDANDRERETGGGGAVLYSDDLVEMADAYAEILGSAEVIRFVGGRVER
jgi:hypothetical protein